MRSCALLCVEGSRLRNWLTDCQEKVAAALSGSMSVIAISPSPSDSRIPSMPLLTRMTFRVLRRKCRLLAFATLRFGWRDRAAQKQWASYCPTVS